MSYRRKVAARESSGRGGGGGGKKRLDWPLYIYGIEDLSGARVARPPAGPLHYICGRGTLGGGRQSALLYTAGAAVVSYCVAEAYGGTVVK